MVISSESKVQNVAAGATGTCKAKPKQVCLIIRISLTSLIHEHKFLKCLCSCLATGFLYHLLGSCSCPANLLPHLPLILTLPTTNVFSARLRETHSMFSMSHDKKISTLMGNDLCMNYLSSSHFVNAGRPFTDVGSAKNHTIHCCTKMFRTTLPLTHTC